MKIQRTLLVLTVVNLGLLLFQLAQIRPIGAQEVAPVLRTRALEIVDEQGNVRADLKVDHDPEVTILHMTDQNGRIRVKVTGNAEGSGLMLANDSQQPGIHLLATKTGSVMTWTDDRRRAHVVKPND